MTWDPVHNLCRQCGAFRSAEEATRCPKQPCYVRSAVDRILEPNETRPDLRWARAASWARGQSFGPWVQTWVDAPDPVWWQECERIEALARRIREVGEDAAYDEYASEIPF